MSRDIHSRMVRRRKRYLASIESKRMAALRKAQHEAARRYFQAMLGNLPDTGFVSLEAAIEVAKRQSVIRGAHGPLPHGLGHHVQPDGNTVSPPLKGRGSLHSGMLKRIFEGAWKAFLGRRHV